MRGQGRGTLLFKLVLTTMLRTSIQFSNDVTDYRLEIGQDTALSQPNALDD